MKIITTFSVVVSFWACSLAFAANYTLSINGNNYDLDLGERQEIVLPDGKKVSVTLEQKSILNFRTQNFGFSHAKEFVPSRTYLGENIWQTMMSTSVGTMVLVQEHESMDPEPFAGMVLESIVGEERDAGYTIRTKNARKELADGKKLKGKISRATLEDTEYIRHIYIFSGNNRGLLILTQLEKGNFGEEQKVLDLFWESLTITME